MPYSNPEVQEEYLRKYYLRNKPLYAQRSLAWSKEHPERRNELSRNSYHRLRDAVMDFLGGKCVVCGWDDRRALQIDHVNGGGTRELKTMGAEKLYKKILNGELPRENYQLLCANHNQIKRIENKEHPYKERRIVS